MSLSSSVGINVESNDYKLQAMKAEYELKIQNLQVCLAVKYRHRILVIANSDVYVHILLMLCVMPRHISHICPQLLLEKEKEISAKKVMWM